MSDHTEHAVQASYKFGQYQQHMLNVRGDGGAELSGALDSVDVQKVVDFGRTIEAVETVQTGMAAPVTAPAAAPAAVAPPSATPPNAAAAPSANVMSCQHGTRVRKSGITKDGPKAGEPWAAHFCPLPQSRKAERCDVVWED